MRSPGENDWITAEALAEANAMLPNLVIATEDQSTSAFHHGQQSTINPSRRYCACCDTFSSGRARCDSCWAPWSTRS